MSITTLKGPSVMSQIGGNLGQSLAEQLPQEVGRQRLDYALKGMQGKSPIEQAQSILSSGGSLQDYAALAPILQQGQKQKILEEKARGGGLNQQQQQQPFTTETQPIGEFATPEQLQTMRQARIKEPTEQDISKLAVSYGLSDPDEAAAKAEKELTRNRKLQQDAIKGVADKINDNYKFAFQSPDLKEFSTGHMSGRTKQWFNEQGEALVDKGMTEDEAASKINGYMEELGDATLRAKENANKTSWFTNPKAKIDGIIPEREIAKQMHQENQFDKTIIDELNISPSTYYDQISPITNPKLKQELQKTLKSSNPPLYFQKHVIPRINPEDNPQSIISDLVKYSPKGYFADDPSPYLRLMREAERNGKLHFTKENKQILKDFIAQKPTYHDLLYFTM